MGFTYTWQADGCTPVRANYDSEAEALAQAQADASVPGAPAPLHITDEDMVVAAAFKSVQTFEVVVDGAVVESKPEPSEGDEGFLVVTQEALEGEELAAYAEALVNG